MSGIDAATDVFEGIEENLSDVSSDQNSPPPESTSTREKTKFVRKVTTRDPLKLLSIDYD